MCNGRVLPRRFAASPPVAFRAVSERLRRRLQSAQSTKRCRSRRGRRRRRRRSAVAVGVVEFAFGLVFRYRKRIVENITKWRTKCTKCINRKQQQKQQAQLQMSMRMRNWESECSGVSCVCVSFFSIFCTESAAQWVKFQLSYWVAERASECVCVLVCVSECSKNAIKNALTLKLTQTQTESLSRSRSLSLLLRAAHFALRVDSCHHFLIFSLFVLCLCVCVLRFFCPTNFAFNVFFRRLPWMEAHTPIHWHTAGSSLPLAAGTAGSRSRSCSLSSLTHTHTRSCQLSAVCSQSRRNCSETFLRPLQRTQHCGWLFVM